MIIVAQRVSHAAVRVNGELISEIGTGLLILAGITQEDREEQAISLANKIAQLRIFPDANNTFNLSLQDTGGQAMVASQFTIVADYRRGRRPSFVKAAPSAKAEPLIEIFVQAIRETGVEVKTGQFGAHMEVDLVNNGPVTMILDSAELEQPRRS